MLKKLILASALFALVGCSGGGEKKGNDYLLKDYSKVVGTYTGKLTLLSGQQHDVQIQLFTLDEASNPDTNGKETTRVTLRANYKKINPVGSDYTFTVAYIPEENSERQLVMTNDALNAMNSPGGANNPPLGRDDVHTINAQVYGQNLVGTARSNAGVIGTFALTIKTTEHQKPIGNQDEEYYDRLTKQFEKVAGEYVGQSLKNGKDKIDFKINLSVFKEGLVPSLKGHVTFNGDTVGSTQLTITATYQPEYSRPILTLTGKLVRFPNSSYQAVFQGTLVNDVYEGAWKSSTRGVEGDFVAKKVVPKSQEPGKVEKDPNFPDGKIPIPTPRPKYP